MFSPRARPSCARSTPAPPTLTGELPAGVIVTLAGAGRSTSTRSSSSAISARDRPTRTCSSRATRPRFRGGVFVYVPAGRRARAADPAHRDPERRSQRAQPAHADRDRGGRPGRGLGAVPVGSADGEACSTASSSSSSPRTPSCATCAVRICRRRAGSSAPSAPRSAATAALDWVALGFGSARGHGSGWRPGSAARARTPGHRRLREPWPPAHRLRHHPGARGAEHDLGPRLPRRPAGPLERRLEGQHHRRSRRAEDRRLPGVAQPAASPSAPTRTRSRASRSRPTTSAARTRRRSPRSTPSSSSTCAPTASARRRPSGW